MGRRRRRRRRRRQHKKAVAAEETEVLAEKAAEVPVSLELSVRLALSGHRPLRPPVRQSNELEGTWQQLIHSLNRRQTMAVDCRDQSRSARTLTPPRGGAPGARTTPRDGSSACCVRD